MIGGTAILRNRAAERSRIRNHPRSEIGRPSCSEARQPESENPCGSRHTIVADTELKVMEVQLGRDISVHDKEKFPFPEV